MLFSIDKLRPTIATVIIVCLASFFNIVLTFFLLDRPLFYLLNVWQLVGIGIGISLPILILNGINYLNGSEKMNSVKGDAKEVNKWAGGGLLSLFVLNLALLISYYYSVPLKTHFWRLTILEVVIFFIFMIPNRRKAPASGKNTKERL
ncbi:MAG: hypothetical protein JSU05_00440 [Bacteroidetes bacterium]|nr:hypothetical protein [Bacteroidota bacterium]